MPLLCPLILAALIAGEIPHESPTVIKAEPLPELDAKFQDTEGWLGGDGVYSVALSDRRRLWLFSDTWVGSIRDGKRTRGSIVNNSVGVQDGQGKLAGVAFSVAKTDEGKPGALFVPPDGRGWFWLYAGTPAGEHLHVFLPRHEKTNEPGAFGFRAIDLWLGTIDNPGDDPTSWKVSYSKVPFAEFTAERKRSFGSALLCVGSNTYIYGYDEKPGKPFPARKLLVARVPSRKLADFGTWQFLGGRGEWMNEANQAEGLCEGLATEFSVSYLPQLKRYILVYTENGLSERIVGRFSSTPEGPWSEPVSLYNCPEMKRNKKVFTYAAKAHSCLSDGNELIVSYVANAFDIDTVLRDVNLYWPRFVRITFK
jgi:hypothetical protein